uniref:Uncharacterized protein n=1 Tax=Hyaloperonospora arabidopsidis (strain Emoy2) TaxID=559515 RepID=M4BN23_HYAAE
MTEDGLELDDHGASAEQPLLEGHEDCGDDQEIKEMKTSWYRSRLFVVPSAVLLLLSLTYLIVSSQITRVATQAINDTTMHMETMDLSYPYSDSVTLNLSLSLVAMSSFPATIDAAMFVISYEHVAVGGFHASSMHVRHGVNSQVFPDATLEIRDKKAWDRFAGDMMRFAQVQFEIESTLTIHVQLMGSLVTWSVSDVPLRKTMMFRGMNGLQDMHIAQVDMENSTQKEAVATIKACVRNPSIATIRPVGALCLNAHYPALGESTLVAQLKTPADTELSVADGQPSHSYCASLQGTKDMRKGYNLLMLTGEMMGANSEAISGLITKYLSNVSAALTVVTCDPQATSVELYNQAMKNLTIKSSLPPQKNPLVGNMFFHGISMHAPPEDKENDMIRLDTAVLVEATSPLGLHSALTITDVRMNVNLTGADVTLGTLSTVSVDIIDGKLIGRSTLKLIGLPLHTTALLSGMDDFQDVTIESFSMPGTGAAADHEEPILTQVEIVNPSVFTVFIGTLTMDLSLSTPREKFGVLHGTMNLAPARNRLEMNGLLKPNKDEAGKISDAVAGFFSAYLHGKSSQVVVEITDTEYTNCVWMREALVGLTITTSFPGVEKGFQMISNIKMNQLDVILDEVLPGGRRLVTNTRMRVRTDMIAKVQMPEVVNISLQISNTSVALTLQNEEGHRLGSLVSGRESCEYNQTNDGAFRLNMSNYYSIGFSNLDDVSGMSGFIKDLLTKNGSVMMRLASDIASTQGAFPDVQTKMGMLALRNIPIQGEPLLPAMDSFRHPPVKVLTVDIRQGSKASMVMSMEFSLYNPSIVRTKLGSLTLDVFFDRARMGSAKISDFSLNCCGKLTILRGTFVYDPQPSDSTTAERFLSNFVCGYFTHGAAQEIDIRGSSESTTLDLLRPAMNALSIPSKLPTLAKLFPSTPTLVTSSLLYIPSILHLTRIPTSLELRNPFSENITLTTLDLELYPCEDQILGNDGKMVCKKYFADSLARFAPAVFKPIFIPANTDSCFSCCQGSHCADRVALCPHASAGTCLSADVQSFLSPEAIATIVHSLTGGLLMRVNGTVGASIGDYATRLCYQQDGLFITMAE